MPTATPGLCLEYLPLPDGGARLVRLYGETPCPVLPAAVDGRPLTELGPYCFAPAQRPGLMPPAGALRRWHAPGPAPEACLPPRIAGSFLEQLTLPECLRVIGEAAFYDCRKLTCLRFGRQIGVVGSDAFTNTFALLHLQVCAAPGEATGLARVLACLPGELRAAFMGSEPADDTAEPLAVLWYPEYWEDIEETPAHILLHTFSGRGYHYRQCFAAGAPAFAEYDAVLHQTGEGDAPATLAMLALERLRWPHALTRQAAEQYRAWLAAADHAALCAGRLLKLQDTGGLRALLALDVLDAAGLEQASALAARAENAEAAALLAAALRQKRAVAKKRYDFDDF